MVKIRLLDTDEHFSLRGSTIEKAIKDDRSNGLIPFFVLILNFIDIIFGFLNELKIFHYKICCTLGTTSCCSFDNILECGILCNKEEIYLHVDGAYAGSALACEEFRQYSNGLEVKLSLASFILFEWKDLI